MASNPTSRPQFPASLLGTWFASFCAVVALGTVWFLPISLVAKVCATELFALVPVGVLLFWLGRWFERRENHRNL
jgi:hypothetical protein